MGVKKVDFVLTLSGNIVKKKYIKSITFKDEIDSKTDEVTVITTAEFPRPNFGAEVTLQLGYKKEGLLFAGKFFIQSSTITNRQLSFRGTGADWTEEIKKRKNRKWEKIKISGIINKIAGEYGLGNKCDKSHFFRHLAQTHESDMHFLQRLARDLNATFSIKNRTLLFLDKKTPKPRYTCNLKKAKKYSFEKVNKTFYKSAELIYRDSKQNKDITIKIGRGTPVLNIKKNMASSESAKIFAQHILDKANAGAIRGRVTIVGSTKIKAGGEIEIQQSKYDDGVYKIKRVTHTLSNSIGWVSDVEFGN